MSSSQLKGLTYSFTDFLVNEISLSGNVLHLHDIGIPPEIEQPEEVSAPAASTLQTESTPPVTAGEEIKLPTEVGAAKKSCDDEVAASLPVELEFEEHGDWPVSTTVGLRQHLSDETIIALRRLFGEGRNPPPRQDSGWGSREKQRTQQVNEEEQAMNVGADARPSQGRGRGRNASNGNPFKAKDSREVVTQVRDAPDRH